MKHWSKPVAPREQCVLFSETLDETVSQNHPIRYLDASLSLLDWSSWEAKYDGYRGQPPIHPRVMAGAILYGLMKRIRSSRDLEEATRERLDFRWFLECRTVDHSTFAGFRKRFEEPLKDLMKQVSRAVVEQSGATELLELILDGTRVRANSERQGARTAERLEQLVQACSEALEEKLDRLARADEQQGQQDREEQEELRRRITELEFEKEKYMLALSEAHRRDAIKQEIDRAKSRQVRVPVTDRDSTILPNKDGGFAPNYTPTVAVESESGAIVSAEVVEGGNEVSSVERTVETCEEVLGKTPERLLADGNFADGEKLRKLEEKGIESYIPAGGDRRESNPANRVDPTQPISPEFWGQLHRTGKRLDSRAFVYEACNDVYYCPMGQTLRYEKSGRRKRTGYKYRTYFCPGRAGCPLAEQCIKGDVSRRSLSRDEHQDVRDRVDVRMASREGQDIYARRAPIVEGVFAQIKQAFGIRQFLLRGIRNVRMEWTWVCTAYNLKKLLKLMQDHPGGFLDRLEMLSKALLSSGECFFSPYLAMARKNILECPFPTQIAA